MQQAFSSPPKAVFFDLDDTLFDHLYSTRQGLQTICQAYPCFQQQPIEVLLADYARLLDEAHLLVLEGGLAPEEKRLERMKRFFLLHGAATEDLPAAIEHAANLHRATYQASWQTVAGARPLLEYLYGKVKIAVVTNNTVEKQVEKLHRLQLAHLVDELVVSEETGFIKPDPRIFQVALQRIGCTAQDGVMIGDAWKADVLGATRVGMRAIWLNRTGIACPDPDLAVEIASFEPLEEALGAILGSTVSLEI